MEKNGKNENERIVRELTNDKFYYTWNDYTKDIEKIKEMFNKNSFDGVISIYRGSLGLGAHISNLFNIPLSVIKVQKIDGDGKFSFPIQEGNFKKGERYLIVDDIYDSGETIRSVLKYFKEFESDFDALCLIGDKNSDAITLNKHPRKWIVFPWEI